MKKIGSIFLLLAIGWMQGRSFAAETPGKTRPAAGEAKPAIDETKLVAPETKLALSESNALQLARRILDDPALTAGWRGAQLRRKKPTADEPQAKSHQYSVVAHLGQPVNELGLCSIVSVDELVPGQYQLLLMLPHAVVSVEREPDWQRLQAQWDAFVARYWPGAKRQDDWQAAIEHYGPILGEFRMSYAIEEKKLGLVSIVLAIRLADGRISGVDATNRGVLLRGRKVPDAPTEAVVTAAVKGALQQKIGNFAGLKLIRTRRSYRVKPQTTQLEELQTLALLQATNGAGEPIEIEARYLETTKTAVIGTIRPVVPDQNLETSRQGAIGAGDAMSYRAVMNEAIDDQPYWSGDGKTLFFTTTRSAMYRPWWQRSMRVQSIMSVQDNTEKVLWRVLKPSGNDYAGYHQPAISPSGRYLAFEVGDDSGPLVAVETRRGVVYMPERDEESRKRMAKYTRDARRLYGLDLFSKGFDWLSDESGYVASLGDGISQNLWLAVCGPNQVPRQMAKIPLTQGYSENVLPRFGDKGRLLAWARGTILKRADVEAKRPQQWQFLVAGFDQAANKLTEQKTLDLKSKPLGISWDSKGRRWLLTASDGLYWVTENAGALQLEPAGELWWGKVKLQPTSAAVSPDGSRVAVAAELAQPLLYRRQNLQIKSMMFRWNGQSREVEPYYDPRTNDIPRRLFPATRESWARMQLNGPGKAAESGWADSLDPRYMIPDERFAASWASALNAAQ